MANNEPGSPPSPTASSNPPRGRRASVTELFTRNGNAAPRLNTNGASGGPPPAAAPPMTPAQGGTIFSAANNSSQAQHHRRTSITTLGLSGSPTQPSPFGTGPAIMRRASQSSSTVSSSPNNDAAVLEENDNESPETPITAPNTPFTRRVSFGAQQALRDRVGMKSGSGEGFNWPEALRTRAERAPSIGSFSQAAPSSPQQQQSPHHHRAASTSTMEMSGHKDSISEVPEVSQKQQQQQQQQQQRQQQQQQQDQQKKQKPKPDYFQEKILRADFMD